MVACRHLAGAAACIQGPKRATPLRSTNPVAFVGQKSLSGSRSQKLRCKPDCCDQPDGCSQPEASQDPEDGEEAEQRVRPISKDDSAFGPRVRHPLLKLLEG